MGSPPPRRHRDADHQPGLVYEVDPAASAAALFSTSTPRSGRRRRHCPATVTGRVILDESSDLIAADLQISPRSTRRILSRSTKSRWQLTSTQLTIVRIYRLDAWLYRAEVELRCAQATGNTVLNLTRWTGTQNDPPNALRFRAATLTHLDACRPVPDHPEVNDLPQLYMRLVLIPSD